MSGDGRKVARELAAEVGRTLFSAFVEWVKSRPLKRLRKRRKGGKDEQKV